jgi:hypothetical protein
VTGFDKSSPSAKMGFSRVAATLFARYSGNSTPVKAGNFFFSADSVDPILALLRQRVPGRIEEIINQAEKICRHRFDLLGYEDLEC